jgi:fucose permease
VTAPTRASLREAWVVWTVGLLIYVLAVFHRASLGVAGLDATERFDISATQLASFTMLQLLVYAGMQVPVGVAIDRYGPKRLLLAGLVLMTVSLIPVVVIAALFTAATVSTPAFAAAVGATVVAAVPFTLMGLAIGYSMPAKAAIVVAQLLFFPLAFGGGLMTAPGSAPGFVETLAPYLPTGAAVRLMWAAVGDFPVEVSSLAALAGWTVALAAVAVWAYRRDEGRRFS